MVSSTLMGLTSFHLKEDCTRLSSHFHCTTFVNKFRKAPRRRAGFLYVSGSFGQSRQTSSSKETS